MKPGSSPSITFICSQKTESHRGTSTGSFTSSGSTYTIKPLQKALDRRKHQKQQHIGYNEPPFLVEGITQPQKIIDKLPLQRVGSYAENKHGCGDEKEEHHPYLLIKPQNLFAYHALQIVAFPAGKVAAVATEKNKHWQAYTTELTYVGGEAGLPEIIKRDEHIAIEHLVGIGEQMVVEHKADGHALYYFCVASCKFHRFSSFSKQV